MSSARNHRIRSHKTYHSRVATTEHFQRVQAVRLASVQAMKSKDSFIDKLFGVFKNGDRKSGNVKGRKEV